MDRLRQDLILAFRRLRSSPGFTLAAILTLALGIGANTAVFTAVNTLIFRPLPVEHPEQLVSLSTKIGQDKIYPVQSYPNYRDVRDRTTLLAGIAGYRPTPVNMSRGESNGSRIWAYEVTGNYFDLLGVGPFAGRVLHPTDDVTKRGHPLAVITYACWQQRFGGDRSVIGERIRLNGLDYTIVGIAPQGFAGTEVVFSPDIFVPMMMEPQIEPGFDWLDKRGTENMFVVGRLKSGVTMAQAAAEMHSLAAGLSREYPKDNGGMDIELSPAGLFGSMLRGAVRGFAVVLMAVAGLVLLIACVNLAGLLLARAADRRKETALRLALGAARGRLIRQLLTESLVLSITGGAAGLLLAWWLTDLFALWRPPVDVPVVPALHVDVRVMIFAALASIAAGVLFGLAPAIQSTRADLAPALKNEAVAERLRRFHPRDFLVAAQVALSVVLVVGSVLVVRSLRNALDLKLGFEPRGAASASFDTALQGYSETRGRDFQKQLLENVRAMPGIAAAGTISGLPLSLNWNNDNLVIEGKPVPKPADRPLAATFYISPGYLHAAGTRLVAGRDLTEDDKKGGRLVALVNETFARQLLPGENPVGKRFAHDPDKPEWIEIVGVVEDGKYRSLAETPTLAVFEPVAQDWDPTATIVARSSFPEQQTAGMLRRAIGELDPAMPVYDPGSLADQLGLVLLPARLAASVLGAFGVVALLLAATGVYGVMAYAVARRTREIGIRMALGAKPAQVLRVVLSQTAWLLGAGSAVGVALSLAAGKLFSQILYGVSSTDPLTYAIALTLLALVAVAACLWPVRRAITVDPVTALRTE